MMLQPERELISPSRLNSAPHQSSLRRRRVRASISSHMVQLHQQSPIIYIELCCISLLASSHIVCSFFVPSSPFHNSTRNNNKKLSVFFPPAYNAMLMCVYMANVFNVAAMCAHMWWFFFRLFHVYFISKMKKKERESGEIGEVDVLTPSTKRKKRKLQF